MLASSLTGCSLSTPPEVPTPSIRWDNGTGPEPSEFESRPEVRHLREYYIGWALAWNNADFQIPQLVATDSMHSADLIESFFTIQDEDPYTLLGPQPFTVVSVTDNPPEGAGYPGATRTSMVNTCLAGDPENRQYVDNGERGQSFDHTRPTRTAFLFVVYEDGTYEVKTLGPSASYSCGDVAYATGYFEPPLGTLPAPGTAVNVKRSALPDEEHKRLRFDDFILPLPTR